MKLNKIKIDYCKWMHIPKLLTFPLIPLMFIQFDNLEAQEEYLKNMEIDSSTKSEENSSEFPTNPFEIVEMLRRANSLNGATNPSDALDEALNSFNIESEKEKI